LTLHRIDLTSLSATIGADTWPLAVSSGGTWSADFRLRHEPAASSPGWCTDTYASDATGLSAQVTTRHLDGGVEWQVQLTNSSSERSRVLDGLASLRGRIPVRDAVLMHTKGSCTHPDDFTPAVTVLDEEPFRLAPRAGRSSDLHLPAFVVAGEGRAVALYLGWSGQWSAEFALDADGVVLSLGHDSPRLYLEPGESITLPSVLLIEAADPDAAMAATRRYLRRHVVPRRPDGSTVNTVAHMTMSTFHLTRTTSTEAEIEEVARSADLGIENYWVDACWYGDEPDWYAQVGSWHPRAADFPAGLRPVSEAAHARDMGFIFWMEPERARTDSAWATQHPDLFLSFPSDPGSAAYRSWVRDHLPDQDPPAAEAGNLLLNLGKPEARELMLEAISAIITDVKADVYRQDMNVDPLEAWRAADAPDRTGITEIRHIEGMYWVWDQLLARHPALVIDNCASGGRRLDLEALRRSLPLWRSDAADVGGVTGDAVAQASQIHQAGLGRWLPDHSGPIHSFDAYSIRSSTATGFVVYRPLPEDPAEIALLRSAITEHQRLRPLLDGDFSVLRSPSLEPGDWCGFQYHSPESGRGFVLAFRSAGAPTSATFELRGLDPAATYRVQESIEYAQSAPTQSTGVALQSLVVTALGERQSLLLEYELA